MIGRFRRRAGLAQARRSRRTYVVGLVVLLLLALAIGEVAADVENSQSPAGLMQERSFIAATVPVIEESTALTTWLTQVRQHASSLGRAGLFAALGRLVTGSTDVEQQYASLGIPAPSEQAGRLLGLVFADRLAASKSLTGAVTSALTAAGHGRALAGMRSSANELHASDAAYLSFIAHLSNRAKQDTAPLPTSSWGTSAVWSQAGLATYVSFLEGDSSLALLHDLTILDLTLEPPALRITPTTTTTTTTSTTTTSTTSTTTTTTTILGASTTSSTTTSSTTTSSTTSTTTTTTTLQIPPPNSTSWLASTSSVQAICVVANSGNVTEKGVVMSATLLRQQPSGLSSTSTTSTTAPKSALRTETVQKTIGALLAGASREVALPDLDVRHGTLYMLTVTLEAPGGAPGTKDSESVRIDIAS